MPHGACISVVPCRLASPVLEISGGPGAAWFNVYGTRAVYMVGLRGCATPAGPPAARLHVVNQLASISLEMQHMNKVCTAPTAVRSTEERNTVRDLNPAGKM